METSVLFQSQLILKYLKAFLMSSVLVQMHAKAVLVSFKLIRPNTCKPNDDKGKCQYWLRKKIFVSKWSSNGGETKDTKKASPKSNISHALKFHWPADVLLSYVFFKKNQQKTTNYTQNRKFLMDSDHF